MRFCLICASPGDKNFHCRRWNDYCLKKSLQMFIKITIWGMKVSFPIVVEISISQCNFSFISYKYHNTVITESSEKNMLIIYLFMICGWFSIFRVWFLLKFDFYQHIVKHKGKLTASIMANYINWLSLFIIKEKYIVKFYDILYF